MIFGHTVAPAMNPSERSPGLKKSLFILILLIFGCAPADNEPNNKFVCGEIVYVPALDKTATIVNSFSYNGWAKGYKYRIRYANDLGELTWSDVVEYELEKYDESAHQGQQQDGGESLHLQSPTTSNLQADELVPQGP